MEREFEEFWSVKPKRKGSNPKEQARLKFLRAVANGADPKKIISAARAWARQEKENGKDETEFVAMAVTWLNQKRFNDYALDGGPIGPNQEELEKMANAKGWFWVPNTDGTGQWKKQTEAFEPGNYVGPGLA